VSSSYIYFHNLHEDHRALALGTSLHFITTMIGAEATLWSTPRRGRRDLAHVQAHQCAVHPARARTTADLRALTLGVAPGHVQLRWRF
jgi:hypothetical protein